MTESERIERIAAGLDSDGFLVMRALLEPSDCACIAAFFDDPAIAYRSTVTMAHHGYGQGEYRYFARPLPAIVQNLRRRLYPLLAPIANRWAERLGEDADEGGRWPATHAALEALCAEAGQTRPTPLILQYGPGDYNRLHQDVYGALVFPMQIVVLLDRPGIDFTGGELVLVEGRARMQSRPAVVPLTQGDAVVIPVRERPIASARGWTKATMRHGVSTIHTGTRRTLGIIFHDAA